MKILKRILLLVLALACLLYATACCPLIKKGSLKLNDKDKETVASLLPSDSVTGDLNTDVPDATVIVTEATTTTTEAETTTTTQPLPSAPAGVTYREVKPYSLPVANPNKSLFDAPGGDYIGSFGTIGYYTVVMEATDAEGYTWGMLSDDMGWTLVYKEILPKMEMYFSSGVGAWSSTLNMVGDGSFIGHYYDVDAGDVADEYLGGTIYVSDFEGAFHVADIGSHSVSLNLTRLKTEKVPHTEWIEDDVRYIAGVAHGIDGGTKFTLYLPNTPVSILPEELYEWSYDIPDYGVLGCYVLYCPKTGNAFFGG